MTPLPRRTTLVMEQLESRLLPYRLPWLNFGPHIGPNEDPRRGAGQISAQMLRQRMEALAGYTDGYRTFGSCGDLRPAGQIAHSLGKRAAIGAWIGRDAAANQAEIDCLVEQALQGHVDVAIVGSEALLRGDVGADTLVGYITQVRDRIRAGGRNVPIGYGDTHQILGQHRNVLARVDVIYANYYPFWEQIPLETAVASLHRDYQRLAAVPEAQGKPLIVGETGWASAGSPRGGAVPSLANAAAYFVNFVSWAEANGVEYAYFEAYDEPWKLNEGDVGPHWGVWYANQVMKPGMQAVFDGQRVPDNWTTPPGTVDFFALPGTFTTNVGTFVVTGTTALGNTVYVNNAPIPPTAMGAVGEFAHAFPLSSGANEVSVRITNPGGGQVAAATKMVTFNANYSTADRELLYVDVVADGSGPAFEGTMVLDSAQNIILGLLPGHVRGISPNRSEIYMENRSVHSTATHQPLRTLAFSQDLPASGFLVSPLGNHLYSRNEVLDVTTNTLLPPLPVDITVASGWAGAAAHGSPAITPDGSVIYCVPGNQSTVIRVDTRDRTATSTGIDRGIHVSGLGVSPDGRFLLVARYFQTSVYDASTYELRTTVPLGDFSGGVVFLPENRAVVGSAGNPQLGGGRVLVIDLSTLSYGPSLEVHMAWNLSTFPGANRVMASSGNVPGVILVSPDSENRLQSVKTFVLGVGQWTWTYGRPANDQIRRLVFKPAPVAHFALSLPPYATAGSSITVTLRARDPHSNLVTDYNGSVRITSSDSQAVHPGNVTLSGRVATFQVTLRTTGLQTLTATATASGNITGSAVIEVSGPASRFLVSAPSASNVGAAFSFTVSALDSSGNRATGYSGLVRFTSSDGSASLPADGRLTAGTGTFSATLRTSGSQTLTTTDTVTASITGTSRAIVVTTDEERFIHQAYLDLLLRTAEPAGLAGWSSFFSRGGSWAQMVQAILASSEYHAVVVRDLYRTLLARNPDPQGLSGFVAFLDRGGTAAQVRTSIVSSAEYFQNRGRAGNEGFLEAIYRDALNRPPDPPGKAVFTDALARGTTRQQVADVIFASHEFRRGLIQGFYRRFLRREGEDSGVNGFVQALRQGAREEDILAVVVASEEYFRRL